MSNLTPLHPRTVRFAERDHGHDAIQKILVVVDPTAEHHPCIEKATRLASGFGSTVELYICDVQQGVSADWAVGLTLMQYRAALREQRLRMLEALAAPIRTMGVHVITETEWRAPLEEAIVRHAISSGADLVVKDTHRHAPASHMPTVQTDWVLIRQLPMPLLLVRPGNWGAQPLIAASVDPCHEAERPLQLDQSLLNLGGSIGRALGGSVTAAHVLQPVPHLPGVAVSDAVQSAALEGQRASVTALAEGRAVKVSDASFTEGKVPDGIVRLASRIRPDILVMGVAARQRLQVGAVSTASQVLERTDCDLLVVKPAGFISPVLVTD